MNLWFDPELQLQMRNYFRDKVPLGQLIELKRGESFTADIDSFYIIESGVFDEVLVSIEGREVNLFRLNWGTLYAEMEFKERQSIPTHLKCVESGSLRRFNRQLVARLSDARFNDELMHSAIRKYRILLSELADLRFNNLLGRLAHLIIRLSVSTNHLEPDTPLDGVAISQPFTHQDLANRLNADRSSVSQLMSQLQKEGVIVIEKRRIVIKNEKKLRELTKFSIL